MERWIAHRIDANPGGCRSWFSYIRDFGRWMRLAHDPDACCPIWRPTWDTPASTAPLYYVHASPDFMDGYADLVADAERVVPETEEP